MALTTAAQQVLKNSRMDSSGIPEQYWDVIERYRAELIAQARAIVGSDEDAEDVVQETFCEAFRDPAKLTDAESIGARLRLINKHNALDRVRDKKRTSKRIIKKQQDDPESTFTTGGFSALELKESVGKALETLPEQERRIVGMRYFEHLPLKEIASRLNLPLGTVGRVLSEASVRLFDKLRVQLNSPPSTTASTQQVPPLTPPSPLSPPSPPTPPDHDSNKDTRKE
jgi:RNA polymerase sigma-70 factor (ECF subfamily)